MDILTNNCVIPIPNFFNSSQKGGGSIGGYGIPSGLFSSSSNPTIYNEYEDVYNKNNDIYDFESSDDEDYKDYDNEKERQSDVLPMNIYMEMIDNVSVFDDEKKVKTQSSLKKKGKKNTNTGTTTKKIKINKTKDDIKNSSKKNKRHHSSKTYSVKK
jgi:hypothetical protein